MFTPEVRAPRGEGFKGVILVLVAALALCLAAVTVVRLSLDAGTKIENLGTANADSTQWALAQTEVEFGSFQLALERAVGHPASDLRDVRRRFDIFYSRMATTQEGKVFDTLNNSAEIEAEITKVRDFLDDRIPIIDAPDDGLRAALPDLISDSEVIRGQLRSISLGGVGTFANSAERQREAVFETLLRLGILTAGFFVVLIISLVALGYFARRNQIEAAQRSEASARFEAIVRTSIDGIIVADIQGKVIEFNTAAQAIFGYSAQEAIGNTLEALIIPPEMREAHKRGMERHRAGGSARLVGKGRIKIDGMRKGGDIVSLELSISTTRHQGEEYFVAYVRDITAQLAAEVELVSARDKAVAGEKAKADLLAVMSHEMRTPLNGLLGTLELMSDTRLSAKQANFLQIIGRSGRILLQHVNDVLDVSRLDAGKMELHTTVFDPIDLINHVIEGQAELAHIHGNDLALVVTGPKPGLYHGDETRLQQILLNLVGNAIKFTRNGKVTVHLARGPNGQGIVIRVSDTGIGISQDQVGRIFQDFVTLDSSYRRNAEGTGLGLGICKRLVTAMQGDIGVESIPGEGSTFWVSLPLPIAGETRRTKASQLISRAARSGPAATGLDILVVEDNQINRFVVREMLAKLGHKVTEAHNGEEGVRFAELRAFDAILMDISMPGMDGVTAARMIRSGANPCKDIPIFALTAHAMPSDLERFREAGMTDAMTKPISSEVLARTLSTVDKPATAPTQMARVPAPKTRIDLKVTREMIDVIGKAVAAPLFGDFVWETDATLADLSAQLAPDMDFGAFEKTSHKIAGSAAVFGANDLRKGLLALEAAARDQAYEIIVKAMPEVLACWAESRSALQVEFDTAA